MIVVLATEYEILKITLKKNDFHKLLHQLEKKKDGGGKQYFPTEY